MSLAIDSLNPNNYVSVDYIRAPPVGVALTLRLRIHIVQKKNVAKYYMFTTWYHACVVTGTKFPENAISLAHYN